jgi:hypothetical protein
MSFATPVLSSVNTRSKGPSASVIETTIRRLRVAAV